ncbi:MAG: hypothetical protein ABIW50_00830 [Candidatus Limnocylindria bacterium]
MTDQRDDDVEGHTTRRRGLTDEPQAEEPQGSSFRSGISDDDAKGISDDDDVEGHGNRLKGISDDDDDTEGHVMNLR